jgi:histidyl-tRNA synthetase
MVAGKRQELAYPLRWYSIPNLWRYERPQAGRLREHWQLNVDIFGIEELDAELEVIQISHEILKNLGATDETFNIRLNTRKLTNYVLADHLGLDDATTHSASKLMDRMHKMERSEFVKLLKEVMPPGKADELVKLLSVKELSELPDSIKSQEPAKRLSALLDLLKKSGITNASYDPTLIRGFDYYTDIVFEVFDNHPDNNRSMFGGGRYDGLVGMFGVEPVPTVGFGMGDVTLQKFIELHDLMPPIGTETDLYVVLIDEVSDHARKVIADFRQMGINVAVDWESQKADKAIKSAVKKQIPFCLFIGAREIQDEQYTLKDLATTKEEHGSVEYLSKVIKAKKAGSRYLHITG